MANRTIKFRGKAINGEWVYGFFSEWNGLAFIDSMLFAEPTRVLRESIGQFIGLYDMNGKEIYEGDVIETGGLLTKLEVYFNESTSSFMVDNKHESAWTALLADMKNVVVIGNIHDNLELLKGE